jgi:hypothetical protein
VIESILVPQLAENGYETAVCVVDGVDHTRDIAVEKGARSSRKSDWEGSYLKCISGH